LGFQGKINIYRKKMKQVMMLSLIWYDSFTWFYSRCSDAGSSNLILLPFHWPPGAKRLTTQDSEIQNIPKCYQNTKRHRFFSQHITPKRPLHVCSFLVFSHVYMVVSSSFHCFHSLLLYFHCFFSFELVLRKNNMRLFESFCYFWWSKTLIN